MDAFKTREDAIGLLLYLTGGKLMPHVLFTDNEPRPQEELKQLAAYQLSMLKDSFLLKSVIDHQIPAWDVKVDPESDRSWFVEQFGQLPADVKEMRAFLLAQRASDIRLYVDPKTNRILDDLDTMLAHFRHHHNLTPGDQARTASA